MLEVRGLRAGYGPLPVLHGVSLHVRADELVGIIGPNGAGKSTLIRAVAGLIRPRSSDGTPAVLLDGEPIDGLPPHEIAKRGLAVVPEGSGVFPHMSVLDNLLVGSFLPRARRKRSQSLARVFRLFPRLAERRHQGAGTLSGGERQMLAIGRALMAAPRFLLLDEPSLGIAPNLARAIMDAIAAINREGIGMILVEQNVPLSLRVCHRAYVMENGVIVKEGSARELLGDEGVKRAYLGL